MLIRAGELGSQRRGIPKRRGYANEETAYPSVATRSGLPGRLGAGLC